MGLVRNIENYVKQNDFKILIKNNCIDIENYTKLGRIDSNEIIVFSNKEKIVIKGSSLTINKLLNSEILILGKYNQIVFEEYHE